MAGATRSRRTRCGIGATVGLLAFALPAAAGETWLVPILPPASSSPAPASAPKRGARPAKPAPAPPWPFPVAVAGESSLVELTTGERYPEPGSAVPPERIDRSFVRLGDGRPMPLTGAKADGPRTKLEATWVGQGLATLAVLLQPEARTAEAAEFEAFLAEAGATDAAALRAKKKETKKPARLVAVGCARAFAGVVAPPRAVVTANPSDGRDEPLGLPLEIVAGASPLPLRAGTSLAATVLLDGKPLPGAVVRAYAAGADPRRFTADAQGAVSVPLEKQGRLLLASAAVRRTEKADRARGEAWKKADWEVRRTSLDLVVLPETAAPVPAPTPRPKPKGKPRPR